ncbi:VWA domain-containing protein [Pseudomonadota bacterium]|nr:VWA domain-containing protein [Pseudomonadota bacterium]
MNLADFHFIRPYWLIALLPVIILILLSVRNKLARGNWSDVCDEALLPFILQDSNQKISRRWSSLALSTASVLAVIAIAGPTWERLPSPVFRNDAAVVIALDLSRSMNATDIKPSRLVRARYKVADILQQRQDGLTALIAYAGDAYTVTPLTQDTNTITNQLNALDTDMMPSQGSNTSAALKQAVELLQQAGQSQGTILLLTDAVSTKSLEQAKSILGHYELSILGIGTHEGAPVKLANGGFLKDSQGNIVVPKLDSAQLRALAHTGGGIYRTITSDDSDINTLMLQDASSTLEQDTDDNDNLVEQWVEQGPWLLLILLPFAALYFRKGLLVVPLIVVMNYPQDSYAYEWQDLWQTDDQQAQQAFEQQHFEEAAAQFQSPEWQAAAHYKAENYQQAAETLQAIDKQTADTYYNQATSLAKAGELEPALESYQKALKLDPKHEDALYNKKLVEDALKKQQQEQQQKEGDSKQGDKEQQDKDKEKSDSSEQQQGDNQDSEQDPSDQQQDKQSQNSGDQKNKQDDDSQQQSEAEKKKQEEDKKAQSEREKAQDNKQPDKAEQQQAEHSANDENRQAQEQWLKRIPDDPAGLLKRKFKYQYNQRNQSSQQEQTW